MAENRLSAQIFALVEHFHQEDPVGLPGAPVKKKFVIENKFFVHCDCMQIPDPFPVPYVKKSFAVGTLTLQNAFAYGMSKFRLKDIKTDLNELTVK